MPDVIRSFNLLSKKSVSSSLSSIGVIVIERAALSLRLERWGRSSRVRVGGRVECAVAVLGHCVLVVDIPIVVSDPRCTPHCALSDVKSYHTGPFRQVACVASEACLSSHCKPYVAYVADKVVTSI